MGAPILMWLRKARAFASARALSTLAAGFEVARADAASAGLDTANAVASNRAAAPMLTEGNFQRLRI
jgi:hypothetical protein